MKFSALSFLALAGSASAFAPKMGVSRSITSLEARKPFISGNWKLNPQTRDEAIKLANDIAATITSDSPDADVALFVPYVFLDASMEAVGDKLNIGAEVSILTSAFRYDHTFFAKLRLTVPSLLFQNRVFAQRLMEPSLELSQRLNLNLSASNGHLPAILNDVLSLASQTNTLTDKSSNCWKLI